MFRRALLCLLALAACAFSCFGCGRDGEDVAKILDRLMGEQSLPAGDRYRKNAKEGEEGFFPPHPLLF